jgi:hypothetical protein
MQNLEYAQTAGPFLRASALYPERSGLGINVPPHFIHCQPREVMDLVGISYGA